MKSSVISSVVFILSFLLWLPTIAQTQLSKEEKKKWKRERRALSPEELKQLVEEKERLAAVEDSLFEANESLQRKVGDQERMSSQLRERVGQLEKENKKLAQMEERTAIRKEESSAQSKEGWNQGVTFRVQIGAIEDKHAQNFEEGSPEFDISREDGYLKYLVGFFRDYEEADKLKKELRKLGLRSAWVVPFRDGSRVPLKEVLSTLE
jgi:myosin heavy subunit